MTHINLFKRITSFAIILFLAAGVLACNEITTTAPQNLPLVDEVGNFSSYEELRGFLSDFYEDSGNGWYSYRNSDVMINGAAEDAVTSAAAPGALSGADDEIDRTHSVSNDQVEGVRETDTIMTDGYYIYVVSGDKFLMIDAETLAIVYTYAMPDSSYSYIHGMFLDEVNDKVVLLANEYSYSETKAEDDVYYYWYYYRYGTRVIVLDVADAANVTIERNMFFDNTYLVDSRMIGGQVYLVLDNYMINYGFEEDSFIPVYYDSAVSDAEIQLPAEDIYYMPNDNYSLSYLMLVSFDATDPEADASVAAYIGSSWQIYMSPTNLYVIMYRYDVDEEYGWYDYQTFVLRFEIVDGELVFKAEGQIDGSPLNQFAMDEYNGAFRIATTEWVYFWTEVTVDGDGDVISSEPYDPAEGGSGETGDVTTSNADDVTTTEADDVITSDAVDSTYTYIQWDWTVENKLFILDATTEGAMPVLGSITEGLGKPNERIYSVRFNGDVAYVVTFVNTDPLYKLDLSDPANPTVVGEWIEAGVSDYLHIINDGLMIGIGREAVTADGWTRFTGVKVSLYDTTGDDPFSTDTYFLESEYSYSPVTYDHKAFMYFAPEGADYWYIAIPVYEYFDEYYTYSQSMYVFKAHFDGDLEYVAKLSHNDETTPYYYYYDSIERSVIIGSSIYTVSYTQIQKFDMANDFAFVAKTVLNEVQYYDYWR